MIPPKYELPPKPTTAEQERAYAIATERDRSMCQRCLRHCGRANRDHRKDRSLGGLTVASNLQILGGSGTTGCHGWKTSHPAKALEEGWLVPSWKEPHEWPARRFIATAYGTVRPAWVLYDDVGGWEEIDTLDAFDRMGRL